MSHHILHSTLFLLVSALASVGLIATAHAQSSSDDRARFSAAGDDELIESAGNLLNRVRAERLAGEGRLRAEVRAQLLESNRRLRVDPTNVAGSLKSLLANVETTGDVNPQLRQELG